MFADMTPLAGALAGVMASVGVAVVVLSSNSTVVQSWSGSGREVYHLYAVVNLGSFTGLFAYPFCVEPFVPLRLQWLGFGVGSWL